MGEANDGPSPAGNDSTSEGKADTPEDFLKEGYAHVWGYSVLHFDLKSWFGKSWFSTPALPGQLSTTGGWGLYLLDQLGVLTCGDFWPWVGWGAVITLAAFLCPHFDDGHFDMPTDPVLLHLLLPTNQSGGTRSRGVPS